MKKYNLIDKFVLYFFRKLAKTKNMDKDILVQEIAKLESIEQLDEVHIKQVDEELIQAAKRFLPFLCKVILPLILSAVLFGLLIIFNVVNF